MRFLEEMIKYSPKLDSAMPLIKLKFRDKISYGGSYIEYDDFFKFKVTEEGVAPVWSLGKDVKCLSKGIDYAPLICVGLAELLHYYTGCYDNVLQSFLAYSGVDSSFNPSDTEIAYFYTTAVLSVERTDGEVDDFLSLFSLKSYLYDTYTDAKRRVVNFLFGLYKLNMPVFCNLVVDTLRVVYPIAPVFYLDYESDEFSSYFNLGASVTMKIKTKSILSYSKPNKIFFNFGKVDYKYPVSGASHSISDGRGIGLYATLIMMRELFRLYGKPADNFIRVSNEYLRSNNLDGNLFNIWDSNNEPLRILQRKFDSCIGSDYSGKFFTGKNCHFTAISSSMMAEHASSIKSFGVVPMNVNSLISLGDNNKILRDYFENIILFKKAMEVEYVDGWNTNLLSAPMSYSSVFSLISDMSYVLILRQVTVKKPLVKEPVVQDSNNSELIEARSTILSLQTQLADMTEKYENLQKQCEKERSNFDYQLSSKVGIIQSLSDENSKLKDRLSNMFSYDEGVDEEVIGDTVSLECMVEELNDFNFLIAGGRYSLESSCKELGWTSVKQLSSVSELRNTSGVDVICVQSRFVSHSLIERIRSYYGNVVLMYYNGTNVEGLIKSCYKFITDYINGEGGDEV